MAIYGNMVGSSGGILGKTVEIISDDGVDLMGVVTDQETVLTATPNDIRKGKIAASDYGIITGEKDIPQYRTTRGSRIVKIGEEFKITLQQYEQYDYTQLQCIITPFNDKYCCKKVVLDDGVYDALSNVKLYDVVKKQDEYSIYLGFTNESTEDYRITYFTYKKEE